MPDNRADADTGPGDTDRSNSPTSPRRSSDTGSNTTESDNTGPSGASPPHEHEHVDVLVVGAGLAGIGAACALVRAHPGRTVAVLEARERLGGTWDLFRFPGVRSDSDMYTLGYAFRPWREQSAIVDGETIRAYLADTAHEYGVSRLIRYGHQAVHASWDSARARWAVEVDRGGQRVIIEADVLDMCTGYYRHETGYTPPLPGLDDFDGLVVHPQSWPTDLDVAGQRIVVLGSGATAITLVPALADAGAEVTMLQRSPTHVLALPRRDRLARALRRTPTRLAAPLLRTQHIATHVGSFWLTRKAPALAAAVLLRRARRALPKGFDVATHFTPRHAPWDQRVCVAADGDLFRVLSAGTASIVTDTVAGFGSDLVRLGSGGELAADIFVTATGFDLLVLGGMTLSVDGQPVDVADRVLYRGSMLTGVPNLVLTFGYTNASWTLKSDLVAGYLCRLLAYLDAHGYASATPRAPAHGARVPLVPLTSGYVTRGAAALPSQGPRSPWRLRDVYPLDRLALRRGRIDAHMDFARAPAPVRG